MELELTDADCRAVEDVVVLAELTEEIILRVLKVRYEDSEIYTNAGNVLMAINPFSQVPLYTDKILNTYRKAYLTTLERLPPHPWKTAAKSYIQMFGDDRQTCSVVKPTKSMMRPQSIVVSGESGAGKTETTKIIMAFLAKVSSLNRRRDSLGTIQCNVLEANTILDAVGNARTMRNDNSSRFGKYVKLHFDTAGELVGAGLDTFLLETTRVVRRNQDAERNFHIFYLLCAEANQKQRERLKIRSPEIYTYLNSSGIYDRRDGVKDSDMLDLFKASMTMLNIEPEDMNSLLQCFMVILTVGNIQFESHTTTAGTVEITVVENTRQYLADAAELLAMSSEDLLGSFTTRTMSVASEHLSVTLTSTQAEEVRDVFAKTLYSVIFAWLIEFLNVQLSAEDLSFESFSLSTEGLPKTRRRERTSSTSIKAGIDQFGSRIRSYSDISTSMSGANSEPPGMIGILDIFGFEKQTQNGLEQLLINYANETLQKQYDEVMIDTEQAFYASENITWDFIEFPSNKDCIDLIASKISSVLTLLDEACLAPSGSDASFIRQVYNGLRKHKRLHLTSRIEANSEFGIKHYAGTVIYSVTDFVKKNKNEIFPLALLKTSQNDFIKRLGHSADIEDKNTKNSTASTSKKKFLTATISKSFKKSVSQLLSTLEETQAHYVKCIKPNSLNVKRNFMVDLVSEQLECNGIMQTIVVTRCGYPIRFTYQQFNDRYNSLMRALLVGKPYSISAGIEAIIHRLQQAIDSGEIIFKVNVTTLDSISGLQKTIKKSRSVDNLQTPNEFAGWGIQRGETRVFLRYNEYGALDTMHDIMVGVMATNIQRVFRGYKCAQNYRLQKHAAVQISKAYIFFHRNVLLMAAVLIMQDFVRNVVMVYIRRKQHARVVLEKLFYRFHCRLVEAAALRRSEAVCAIQGWWKHTPWVKAAPHRAHMDRVFSPVIRCFQQAVRDKLLAIRKARILARRNSKSSKPVKRTVRSPSPAPSRSSIPSRSPAPAKQHKSDVLVTPKKVKKSVGARSNSDSKSNSNVNSDKKIKTNIDSPSNSDINSATTNTNNNGDTANGNGGSKSSIDNRSDSFNNGYGNDSSNDRDVTPPRPPVSCRDLLKANSHILWSIFVFYSKDKASIPGNSMSSIKRNATRLVSTTGMISLLKDWSLIPSLSSQYKANHLLKEEMANDKSPSKLFAFTHFLSFINKLASSFYKDNDTRELTDKIKLLDDQLQWNEDVIVVKHLLTIMNTSDGRMKFSQARNTRLIPSFVGVDGSEDALLVHMETQTNSSHQSPQPKAINPTFREVDMSEAVLLLMRKNESTLISLALRYCPPSKAVVTTSPGFGNNNGTKKDSRKSHVIMSMDAVYNCLHDFEVCPIICGKSVFQTLYRMVETRTVSSVPPPQRSSQKGDGSRGPMPAAMGGLSYAAFIELLDHVAQNCVFGGKKYTTPEGRVRAMFHHMNSSRGRSKLNRDPNSLIITPLTGLESMDPQLESNSSHRKNVVSKVSARLASQSTPEKSTTPPRTDDSSSSPQSPSRNKLPMSHYQHLRTIKTPPRASSQQGDAKPEWNFR